MAALAAAHPLSAASCVPGKSCRRPALLQASQSNSGAEERHFLLQAYGGGDDDDALINTTAQLAGEPGKALGAYVCVLDKQERAEVRCPNHSSTLRTGCCRRALLCLR